MAVFFRYTIGSVVDENLAGRLRISGIKREKADCESKHKRESLSKTGGADLRFSTGSLRETGHAAGRKVLRGDLRRNNQKEEVKINVIIKHRTLLNSSEILSGRLR
ncbi:MAG TPA: hypothetical protein PLN61_07505 [bacterium]|nr:hypothetical protein [bacterium]